MDLADFPPYYGYCITLGVDYLPLLKSRDLQPEMIAYLRVYSERVALYH